MFKAARRTIAQFLLPRIVEGISRIEEDGMQGFRIDFTRLGCWLIGMSYPGDVDPQDEVAFTKQRIQDAVQRGLEPESDCTCEKCKARRIAKA